MKYVVTLILEVENKPDEKKIDARTMGKFIESRVHPENVNEDLFRVGKCSMKVLTVQMGVAEV